MTKTASSLTYERKTQRGLKNSDYLGFLSRFPSRVSKSWGSFENPLELHHEALTHKFAGTRKSWNDYQAIPLTREEHASRHATNQELFWGEKNPRRIAWALMKNYCKGKGYVLPEEFSTFPSEETEYNQKTFVEDLCYWLHEQERGIT